jgi:uncharacterized membrane protein YhaH (DUF805 family)
MTNPYSAPGAAMSGLPEQLETYEPKVFAWKGRIGRLRYLAYVSAMSILMLLLFVLVLAIASATRMENGESAMVVWSALLYLPAVAVSLVIAKRRLNDLDRSGWFSLLTLVPFVNFFFSLYLVFGAGTEGGNRYGPPAGPNTAWVKLGACVPVLAAIVGIMAAIAIPAYSGYAQKASAAASSQL